MRARDLKEGEGKRELVGKAVSLTFLFVDKDRIRWHEPFLILSWDKVWNSARYSSTQFFMFLVEQPTGKKKKKSVLNTILL